MENPKQLAKRVQRTVALLIAAGVRHMQVTVGRRAYRVTIEPLFTPTPLEFKSRPAVFGRLDRRNAPTPAHGRASPRYTA